MIQTSGMGYNCCSLRALCSITVGRPVASLWYTCLSLSVFIPHCCLIKTQFLLSWAICLWKWTPHLWFFSWHFAHTHYTLHSFCSSGASFVLKMESDGLLKWNLIDVFKLSFTLLYCLYFSAGWPTVYVICTVISSFLSAYLHLTCLSLLMS